MKKIFGVIAAVVLLSGCGIAKNDTNEETVNTPSDDAIVYNCQGQEVKVDYTNDAEPQTAQLFFTGKTHEDIVLPLVTTDAGAKYSDGTVIFWTRQNEATLSMESDDASITCVQQNMTGNEDVTMNEV